MGFCLKKKLFFSPPSSLIHDHYYYTDCVHVIIANERRLYVHGHIQLDESKQITLCARTANLSTHVIRFSNFEFVSGRQYRGEYNIIIPTPVIYDIRMIYFYPV